MLFRFVFKVIITVCAGIVACNWLVILSVCITLMCTFDPTGRTFVKLKATRRRQRNLTTYTLRYQKVSLLIINYLKKNDIQSRLTKQFPLSFCLFPSLC